MIGLMDCNNFFVSCERLFRPDLVNKPVAVLSSNDGCIIARSQEVKDLGVPMGIPYFEVKDLCKKHDVTLFSTNLTLYRDISARVMSALRSEFAACEVYSVDEAFFDVPDTITPEELALIRSRIIQKTGIPVSIGVAATKTRAKVAGRIAKGNGLRAKSATAGVCILTEELWKETIQGLSCGSIWGIGRQTSAFLSQSRIQTVADLLKQDPTFIRQSLGVVGERLCLELRGTPAYTLGESFEIEQESYTSTRSFALPVREKTVLLSALGYHVAHVAEKLRTDACVASKITIIAQGSRHGAYTLRQGIESTVFTIPTNDTITLTKEVSKLLDTLYDPEIPYKKAGVVLSGIRPTGVVSGSLFGESTFEINTKKLNTVTDLLNKKFGSGTVRSGVTLGAEKWKTRRTRISNEYTTRWSEIATVKAT